MIKLVCYGDRVLCQVEKQMQHERFRLEVRWKWNPFTHTPDGSASPLKYLIEYQESLRCAGAMVAQCHDKGSDDHSCTLAPSDAKFDLATYHALACKLVVWNLFT